MEACPIWTPCWLGMVHRPRIERQARYRFRHLRCAHQRDEAIAETIALAWLWFVRLARRGKDAASFISTLAALAARAVMSGRRLCGQQGSRDALSSLAQRRHSFFVHALSADHHDHP